jgi:hypothetical protein
MPARQVNRVRGHIYLVPIIGRLMAFSALKGGNRIVRAYMAGIALAQLAVEVALLVAIETDAHRADSLAAHRVKTVPDRTVTVTARDVDRLAMGDRGMGRAQAILREHVWKILMAGHTDPGIALRRVDDNAAVCRFYLLCIPVTIVAGDTPDRTVDSFRRQGLDDIQIELVSVNACIDKRLLILVTGLALPLARQGDANGD